MFNKLQIFNFENLEIEKNDKFLYNCYLYIYLDSNNKIVHQEFHIKNRIQKSLGINKQQKIELNIEDCTVNEEGNLIKRTTKKEGYEIFKNYKGEIGGGITILSLVGGICSAIFFPAVFPVSIFTLAGGAILWKFTDIFAYIDYRPSYGDCVPPGLWDCGGGEPRPGGAGVRHCDGAARGGKIHRAAAYPRGGLSPGEGDSPGAPAGGGPAGGFPHGLAPGGTGGGDGGLPHPPGKPHKSQNPRGGGHRGHPHTDAVGRSRPGRGGDGHL